MQRASLTVNPDHRVGPVQRRIFGSFVEHMGRCVYTGIYEPGHPNADEHGFRGDVADLTREAGVTVVRYPGGNFVSGYRWEDGVGPVEQRPAGSRPPGRASRPTRSGSTSSPGGHTKPVSKPMMAVNLGTRGVEEAVTCSSTQPPGRDGAVRPARIGTATRSHTASGSGAWATSWTGPGRSGHKTADEYGRLAAETATGDAPGRPVHRARGLRQLATARCPRSARGRRPCSSTPTTPVDYISLHAYYEERDGDLASFLASSVDMDRFIEAVIATADHVGAKHAAARTINLSFDEWNVWYQTGFAEQPRTRTGAAPRLIEDTFYLADAVAVGSLLHVAASRDRVKIACQAQLVNVIAPIRTEAGGPAWRQTIFHRSPMLPPLRGATCCGSNHAVLATTTTSSVRLRSSTPSPLTTTTVASSRSSPSTAARGRASLWTSGYGHFPGHRVVGASGDC